MMFFLIQPGVSRDDFLKLVQHSEIPVNERYGIKKYPGSLNFKLPLLNTEKKFSSNFCIISFGYLRFIDDKLTHTGS